MTQALRAGQGRARGRLAPGGRACGACAAAYIMRASAAAKHGEASPWTTPNPESGKMNFAQDA